VAIRLRDGGWRRPSTTAPIGAGPRPSRCPTTRPDLVGGGGPGPRLRGRRLRLPLPGRDPTDGSLWMTGPTPPDHRLGPRGPGLRRHGRGPPGRSLTRERAPQCPGGRAWSHPGISRPAPEESLPIMPPPSPPSGTAQDESSWHRSSRMTRRVAKKRPPGCSVLVHVEAVRGVRDEERVLAAGLHVAVAHPRDAVGLRTVTAVPARFRRGASKPLPSCPGGRPRSSRRSGSKRTSWPEAPGGKRPRPQIPSKTWFAISQSLASCRSGVRLQERQDPGRRAWA
jgi:hypothetical protein